MASGTNVHRIPLSDYLDGLKESSELFNCGYTHQALCNELQYQMYLDERVDLVRESKAGEDSVVRKELHDISKLIEVNKECLHYMGGITDLEDFYSDLTAFNTKRALELVSQRMGSRFWKRKLSNKVRKAWQNLGKYSELVTLHLKNAADFHQFYYDARQIEVKLNERCQKFVNARRLNRVLLGTWKEIIDERLENCLKFFKRFLQTLCESDRITTADDNEFRRLLQELHYSLRLPPTASEDNDNPDFLALIKAAQLHWEQTARAGSTQPTGDNVFHLKKTDISTYHSVLVWIKIHMKTNMEYELQLNSTVKEKDQLNELRAESYRITEAVTLLNELASRDKEKVKELLKQLRLWNRQQPTNIMGKCSPPTSSSGEILTSSCSELSGTELSETESEIISEVAYESSKVTHFTKEYRPNMTYVLPAIFTYDEQSLSDEIGSSGEVSGHEVPPSRFIEDDYFENQTLHKWRFEKEFVEDVETTETESVNSDVPVHYISTKHLPMGMTLDPHFSLQSGTRTFFKSRRQINTTDMDSSYSVVYIEVARSDPAMQSQLSDENLRGDQRNKEVQVDQRVLTPRVKKIVELREEEEEAESSVLKQQKRTKIIPLRIKKQDASTQVHCTNTDVAVDARPCRRDAASMISDKDEITEYYKLIPIHDITPTLTPILTEHPEGYDINTTSTQTDHTCPLMVPEEFYHINTQQSAGMTGTYGTEHQTQENAHKKTQTDEKKMSKTFVEVDERAREKAQQYKTTTNREVQTERQEENVKDGEETRPAAQRKMETTEETKEYARTRERAVTTIREQPRYKKMEEAENLEKRGGRTSMQSAVAPTPSRPGHCSLCGQR
ncbi:hypothetical protein PHET_03177, partial [Paragonimus heterotremus]